MRSRISYWPKRSGPDVDTVPVASAGREAAAAGAGLAGTGGGAGAAAGFGRAAILMPESVSEIMRSISVSVEKRGAVGEDPGQRVAQAFLDRVLGRGRPEGRTGGGGSVPGAGAGGGAAGRSG